MILEESILRRSRAEKVAFARLLRENPTRAERILWTRLRRGRTGFCFHRQKILKGFIVDLFCERARLIVEVDGGIHGTPAQMEADHRRERVLTAAGFKILRIQNEEIFEDVDRVVAWIVSKARERMDPSMRARASDTVCVGHPRASATIVEIRDDSAPVDGEGRG